MPDNQPLNIPPKNGPYSEADKLHWEVERLKEETKNLKRPLLRNPNYLLTTITIIIAAFGMLLQYQKSDIQFQKAELERAKTEKEIEKAKEELERVTSSVAPLKEEKKELERIVTNLRIESAAGNSEAVRKTLEQPVSVTLFDNNNPFGVINGPTRPTEFRLDQSYYLTSIYNYHWNDGKGSDPQNRLISVRHNDGTIFGAWPVSTSSGQGGSPNVNWECFPNTKLPAGTYTVIDPDPATWSQNERSQHSGFTRVRGYASGN